MRVTYQFWRIFWLAVFSCTLSGCQRNHSAEENQRPSQKPISEQPASTFPAASSLEPARFDIIQSTLAAKWTFRLDRFSGHVCQLVQTSSKGLAWQEMVVRDLPVIEPLEKQVRFQLFTSTLAARHTYLIDLMTGKTWTLTTLIDDNGKEMESIWCPFAYQ